MAHAVEARTQVRVRDVHGPDELRACQELQRRAWGITEDGYVLPVATMAGAQKVGGVILGAFEGTSDRLIGFSFAFLGRLRNRLVLYSQLTGVHPAHQSAGVGRLLKFEQRRRARDLGLEAVVWAFDPLQASNAAFNLGLLGAVCQTYEVDMYGSRSDTLNSGLATDRLLAEWSTAEEPAPVTQAPPDATDLIELTGTHGLRRPSGVRAVSRSETHLQIEVPRSIGDVKAMGAAAASEWQAAVRAAFQSAFAAGFVAVGFSRADAARPRYLLERLE